MIGMRTPGRRLTNQIRRGTLPVFSPARKGCFFLLVLVGVSLLPSQVLATPVLLLDLMPKTVNGENGAFLQSRMGSTYNDLEFLQNSGDYWFGTPGTPQGKPLITRGVFPGNVPRDPFSVYAFPSNVNQTGFKADAVIRWKLPKTGNRIRVNGYCLREGRNAFPIRFYIYLGSGSHDHPLWETVNGGDFNLLLNYSAGDEIFFGAECLAEDINIRGRWENVTLDAFSEGPAGGAPAQPTGNGNQAPPSPWPAFPGVPLLYLLITAAVFACGVGLFAARRYGMIPALLGNGPGPVPAPGTSRETGKTSTDVTTAERGSGDIPAKRSPAHHDVFICYSNHDKPVADAICAHLEAHAIRCWIAPRDVLPGEDFPESIIGAIEESRVMVLVFSSHANSSHHVLRELTKAVSRGVIIIPFRIEDVLPSRSMEYLIGLPHWLDALTPPLEAHIETLVRTVDIFLKKT
jgi:hypothetical protein